MTKKRKSEEELYNKLFDIGERFEPGLFKKIIFQINDELKEAEKLVDEDTKKLGL